jgi:TatD DNase family protein
LNFERFTMINVIDTHAHLDEIANLSEVIDRAVKSGVKAIVAVGQDHTSNLKTLSIAKEFSPIVYPAFGLHPWHIGRVDDAQITDTIRFIDESSIDIVAIGEIGLDYDKRVLKIASKEAQKAVLVQLLDIARKRNKPVLIHSRYAWKDCFDLVKAAGIEKAVFHWFTGPSDVLMDIIASGYHISATPGGEYQSEHQRTILETPLTQLMLETDSPVEYGKETRYTSEPKDAIRSLRAVAAIKNEDEFAIADMTLRTTIQFFGLATEIVREGQIGYNE